MRAPNSTRVLLKATQGVCCSIVDEHALLLCHHHGAVSALPCCWLVFAALTAALPVQIGGVRAPSPVGELGNVEMTQALQLAEAHWQPSGPDMLLSGVCSVRTHNLILVLMTRGICAGY